MEGQSTPEQGGLMVRNLDTGEYVMMYDLDQGSKQGATRDPAAHPGHGRGQLEAAGAEDASTSIKSSSKTSWLKGAKHKVAKVAKKTLTAIQEKVEEAGMQHRAAGEDGWADQRGSGKPLPRSSPLEQAALHGSGGSRAAQDSHSLPVGPLTASLNRHRSLHQQLPALEPLPAAEGGSGRGRTVADVSGGRPAELLQAQHSTPQVALQSHDSTTSATSLLYASAPYNSVGLVHGGSMGGAGSMAADEDGSLVDTCSMLSQGSLVNRVHGGGVGAGVGPAGSHDGLGGSPSVTFTSRASSTVEGSYSDGEGVAPGLQGQGSGLQEHEQVSQQQQQDKVKGGALSKTLLWGKAQKAKLLGSRHGRKGTEAQQLLAQGSTPEWSMQCDDQGRSGKGGASRVSSSEVEAGEQLPAGGRNLKGKLMKLVHGGDGPGVRDRDGGKQPSAIDTLGGAGLRGRQAGGEEQEEGEGLDAGGSSVTSLAYNKLALSSAAAGLGQPAPTRSARTTAATGRLLSSVRLIQSIPAHDGVVWVAAWHPSGTLLATGGQDGVTRVWATASHSQRSDAGSLSHSSSHRSHLASQTSLHTQVPPSSQHAPGIVMRPSMYPDQDMHTGGNTDEAVQGVQGPASLASTSSALHLQRKDSLLQAGSSQVQAQTHGPPVLCPEAAFILQGHTEDVLDLAWSPGNFLLTASPDLTTTSATSGFSQHLPTQDSGAVGGQGGGAGQGSSRLLHSLLEFPHPDFVTCVCFHPHDSQLFVSGCADGRVRVWSVLEAQVLATAVVPQDMITCITWMPDGAHIVAGTLQGKCRQYAWHAGSSSKTSILSTPAPVPIARVSGGRAPGNGVGAPAGGGAAGGGGRGSTSASQACRLEYMATIDVKDRRGQPGSGRKVTSVVPVPGWSGSFLVASNDSRVRLYYKYSLEVKFKGGCNRHTLVRAGVDEAGTHVVCGSDNGWVYLWDLLLPQPGPGAGMTVDGPSSCSPWRPKNGFYDAFLSREPTSTVALVAPKCAWRVTTSEAKHKLLATCGQVQGGLASAAEGADGHLQARAGGAGGGLSVSGQHPATLGPHPALNSPLLGGVFIVAGFSGRLHVYENL